MRDQLNVIIFAVLLSVTINVTADIRTSKNIDPGNTATRGTSTHTYVGKTDTSATASLRMMQCAVKKSSSVKGDETTTREDTADPTPRVVETVPETLANEVLPDVDKITVTFDKKMRNGSWSWTGGGETFPKVTGKPHYDDKLTTCTLPVKLQPGKVYWIGINSPSHKNFKSTDRVPARRYVILFATKGADGKATPIPQDMLERAKRINGSSPQPQNNETASRHVEARKLLDAETLRDVTKIDRSFAPWFQPEGRYEAASDKEKSKMVKNWIQQAQGNNFKRRVRAIAALGNVRAKQAVDVLMEIAEEPMRNNRPRWMAVRALGEIGDKKAIPVLIELVDHGNWNTRVYAKSALAQITGVYFGTDKAKWHQWWKENQNKA